MRVVRRRRLVVQPLVGIGRDDAALLQRVGAALRVRIADNRVRRELRSQLVDSPRSSGTLGERQQELRSVDVGDASLEKAAELAREIRIAVRARDQRDSNCNSLRRPRRPWKPRQRVRPVAAKSIAAQAE